MSTTTAQPINERLRNLDASRSTVGRLAEIDDEIDEAVAAGNRKAMERLVEEIHDVLTEIEVNR